MPKKVSELTVTIEAKEKGVPTSSLTTVLNHFAGILRSLAKQIAKGQNSEIKWEITGASMNSPLTLTLVGVSKNSRLPTRVARECVRSFKLIEQEAQFPEKFTHQDLVSASNMVSVLNDGIKSLKISAREDEEVVPTLHLVANVQKLQQSYKVVYASFRGRLHDIHTHGETHDFEIYDQLTDQKIKCIFPEEKYKEVGTLLKQRVIVYGKVKLSNHGVPVSIEVTEFEGLPSELRKISEAAPLEVPNGLDAVDYVRKVRRGEVI